MSFAETFMQTILALGEHSSNRPMLAPLVTQSMTTMLVAAAVLLPLVAVIVISQRLSSADSSLIISGITGIAPSSLCRADIRQDHPVAFGREQLLAALNKP